MTLPHDVRFALEDLYRTAIKHSYIFLHALPPLVGHDSHKNTPPVNPADIALMLQNSHKLPDAEILFGLRLCLDTLLEIIGRPDDE